MVDRRNHIGGNAYDCYDEAGILMHKYGPHIFHTNAQAIVDYLSQFTEWRPYEHRVLGMVDGKEVPIPINRDTINRLYGLSLSTDEEVEAFFQSARRAGGDGPHVRGRGGGTRGASSTRSSSRATRASSGASIPRSSTSR